MKLSKILIFAALFITTSLAANNPLWMRYPQISPDGTQIAFSYKGDLWVVNSEGGTARQLTTHESYDYHPIWSNDGSKIAFASDRFGNFDIYVIDAQGGIPNRLTYHSSGEVPNAFTRDDKNIIFTAQIQDVKTNVQFPYGLLTELYSIPVNGGKIEQIFSTPAQDVTFSLNGDKIIYHDVKGYEDNWRKHHTSSVTRDIWTFDFNTKKHKKITSFKGEDRNPVLVSEDEFYYLSEQYESNFNVVKSTLSNPAKVEQVTNHKDNPVRFLSIDKNKTLCYSYNGEIYTKKEGQDPQKISVNIISDQKNNAIEYTSRRSGATEMNVSPDGKEIVFVVRGDVYVTSLEYSTTKQITNTPQQERSASFSPDGKYILYASERNGSWDLYQTKKVREEEKYFSTSTLLEEEVVLEDENENFQAEYAPDGKHIAYIQDRQSIAVYNIETKKVKVILPKKYNYSYSDGDMWFNWSPDSKWLLAQYNDKNNWPDTDVALINIETGEIKNMTESGYSDGSPKWMQNGEMIIWFSDKQGYRSHGSWGAQSDVYAMFLNEKAWDKFKMSKEEYELYQEAEKEKKKEEKKAKEDDKKSKGKKDKKDEPKVKPIEIDFANIEDRKARLTIHSSSLSDAVVSPDGLKLYYLSRFEGGFDLWVQKLKEGETKLLTKLNGFGGGLTIDDKGKYLYLFTGGRITRIEAANGKRKVVSFNAEKYQDDAKEREYIFNHAWKQVQEKFYKEDLHGAKWDYFKENYSKFLEHINNNYDFAEMLSEMLGELNGSHTGARYGNWSSNGDRTASLGIFIDFNFNGNGIRIDEIMDKSPLISADTKIKEGVIIEKIDGQAIANNNEYYKSLNHKRGKTVLLSLYNPQNKERWEETVKPISLGFENELLYQRYVKNRRAEVEKLSNGRIGYVHVRGMNSSSFRDVYSEVMGRYANKEALVVDTRFNGGGWLHDDLATLLSGKKYADFNPRGQYVGSEPHNKWKKPSVVLMGEGNYSDAHAFPFTYKSLKIGKLIGMPVPGTMTAVWWERQIDPSIVFGIPQLGVKDMNGKYLENQELQPDIKVSQEKEIVVQNRDQQIEAAVKELLQQLK